MNRVQVTVVPGYVATTTVMQKLVTLAPTVRKKTYHCIFTDLLLPVYLTNKTQQRR